MKARERFLLLGAARQHAWRSGSSRIGHDDAVCRFNQVTVAVATRDGQELLGIFISETGAMRARGNDVSLEPVFDASDNHP